MKRVYKSRIEPELLRRFREEFPDETWEHFRRHSRKGYKEVKKQILRDQRGLCAYCEISIKMADTEGEVDDFRVEHFYPKSASAEDGHNYHLDWRNLLGVCHGGSQPDVPDAEWRYSSLKSDRSCDVPKGGKTISGLILNPLNIPGRERLFCYAEHSGKMMVDEKSCPRRLRRKAHSTIRELNLNARRLMRMREMVIIKLEEEVSTGLDSGESMEEIFRLLAESMLLPDEKGNCLPFFSVIRWFLGDAAEEVIRKSGSLL